MALANTELYRLADWEEWCYNKHEHLSDPIYRIKTSKAILWPH